MLVKFAILIVIKDLDTNEVLVNKRNAIMETWHIL